MIFEIQGRTRLCDEVARREKAMCEWGCRWNQENHAKFLSLIKIACLRKLDASNRRESRRSNKAYHWHALTGDSPPPPHPRHPWLIGAGNHRKEHPLMFLARFARGRRHMRGLFVELANCSPQLTPLHMPSPRMKRIEFTSHELLSSVYRKHREH